MSNVQNPYDIPLCWLVNRDSFHGPFITPIQLFSIIPYCRKHHSIRVADGGVQVLVTDAQAGKPKLIIITWQCHATTIGTPLYKRGSRYRTANPVVFGSPQPTQGHRTWARNGPRMHGISISAIPWQPTGTVQEIPLGY